MLISLAKNFVFVANLKTASTTIEAILRPVSQVALTHTRFGKHQPFSKIENRFAWILSCVDPKQLLVFCVIRDPVDLMVSLYNSHRHENWKKETPQLYTGDLDFDGFLREWPLRNCLQALQQYLRLLDSNGHVAANYIISYHKLAEGLRYVSERIAMKELISPPRKNVSYGRFNIDSVTPEQRLWIEAHFAQDREVLNKYSDRFLTERPYIAPHDACKCGFCIARSKVSSL